MYYGLQTRNPAAAYNIDLPFLEGMIGDAQQPPTAANLKL
jgi:hypothetical protein